MNHIRTSDPTIRNAQWGRLRAVTAAYCLEAELIRRLQPYLAAMKAYQKQEWYRPQPDTALLRALALAIKEGQARLTLTTDSISSLQGELESLKTALDDTYEESVI